MEAEVSKRSFSEIGTYESVVPIREEKRGRRVVILNSPGMILSTVTGGGSVAVNTLLQGNGWVSIALSLISFASLVAALCASHLRMRAIGRQAAQLIRQCRKNGTLEYLIEGETVHLRFSGNRYSEENISHEKPR
jgi:hypothetical protein